MRIASHLRMSISKCQEETSSAEFVEWLVWLEEQELTSHSKEEYYLAQIALEIRRTINPKQRYSLDKFLLKFYKKPQEKDLSSLTQEEYEEEKKKATEQSKRFWFTMLKFNPNKAT